MFEFDELLDDVAAADLPDGTNWGRYVGCEDN
jgi:hypothetical protein